MGSHMEFDMAGDAGALIPAGMAAMALKFELLKNTINMDKLMERFESRTNDIFQYILAYYQDILKYNISILSKFIENKNFF